MSSDQGGVALVAVNAEVREEAVVDGDDESKASASAAAQQQEQQQQRRQQRQQYPQPPMTPSGSVRVRAPRATGLRTGSSGFGNTLSTRGRRMGQDNKLRGAQGLVGMFEADPKKRAALAKIARSRYQHRAQASYIKKMSKLNSSASFTATGEIAMSDDAVAGASAHTWDAFALRSATRSLAFQYLPVEDKIALHRLRHPEEARRLSKSVVSETMAGGVFNVPVQQLPDVAGSHAGIGDRVDLDRGLTQAQVEASRQLNGPNTIPPKKGKNLCLLMLKQLVMPINLTVVLLAVMSTYKFIDVLVKPDRDLAAADVVMVLVPWTILLIICVTNGLAEMDTGDTLKKLSALGAAQTRVVRDGIEADIAADELVPGDVVLLATGDTVPADMRVLEAVDLACVEASLTGEPDECIKTTAHRGDPAAPFRTNAMYSSTSVVSGKGRGIVTSTGLKTCVGQISGKIGEVKEAMSPLQKTMQRVGGVIILIASLMVVVFTIVIGARGDVDAAPFGGNVWVAALFEGLNMAILVVPTVLTILVLSSMKLGVKNLSKLGVQMRRLTAVETLGAATVICSDKTGTLTAGKMTAVEFMVPEQGGHGADGAPRVLNMYSDPGAAADDGSNSCEQFHLKQFTLFPQRGFDPAGGVYDTSSFTPEAQEKASKDTSGKVGAGDGSSKLGAVQALWSATLLNCDPGTMMTEDKESGAFDAVGNMSEAALVVGAAKAVRCWDPATDVKVLKDDGAGTDLRVLYPDIAALEIPFSSKRKMKATVHTLSAGGNGSEAKGNDDQFCGVELPQGSAAVAVVKGAPDRVLPHIAGGIDESSSRAIVRANEAFADQALRVLVTTAVALDAATVERLKQIDDADERLETILAGGLSFLGLMGLRDPPREGVQDSVATCRNAAVRVVMITGDQVSTAEAISEDLGIVDSKKKPTPVGNGAEVTGSFFPGQLEDVAEDEDEDEDGGSVASNETVIEVDLESGAAVAPTALTCAALHVDPADPAASAFRSNQEIDAFTNTVNVFARAQPTDKVAIVESFQRKSDITVMTGDGVNDAAALKAADIGVSMGIAGTEVAKSAADMILVDDSFTAIVDAVEEGRRIFSNLQKYIIFFCGAKGGALVQFGICIFAGLFAPMGGTKSMVYWYPCILALSCTLYQTAEPYLMSMPPRDAKASPMNKRMWILRALPAMLIFQICVLIPVFLGKYAYSGNLASLPTTTKISDFLDHQRSCLMAKHPGPADAPLPYVVDEKPIFCQCPDMSNRDPSGVVGHAFAFGRPWEWQYGSDVNLERSDGSFNEEIAEAFHFDETAWVWGGDTGSLYAKNSTQGTWSDEDSNWRLPLFYNQHGKKRVQVLGRCNATQSDPDDSNKFTDELCWTEAAGDVWGRDESGRAKIPSISKKFSCGAWGIRKSNSLGWMAYSWTEITFTISLRTESPFWQHTGPNDRPSYIKYTLALLYVFLFVYIPPLAEFAGTIGSHPVDVGVCACFGIIISLLLHELFKLCYRRDLAAFQIKERSRLGLTKPARAALRRKFSL